ncbi:MAG TPA: DUF2007 domain-containing protein [Granulicella sp.]
MNDHPNEFADLYAAMSDSKLMELAQSYDSLIDRAQSALRTEFARRGLEPPLIEEPSQPTPKQLATVRRYRDLSEAIVARSLLESGGIEAYLYDENLVRLEWQISNLIGGIRLQVAVEDQTTALALLDQSTPDFIEFAEGQRYTQPHCPVCNSIDIIFEGESRKAALASLYVMSLPLPLGSETWRCNACGTRWEETE